MAKQIHLGLLLEATGRHVASWLDPRTNVAAATDIDHYVRLAQQAEAARLDMVFASDSPGIPTDNLRLMSRRALFMTRFEPLTLLAAIARETSRIGLGATVSTSFTEPYNVARYFASLEHISHGRSGWNVVTSASDYAARNFGLTRLPDHAARYARATEFVRAVNALWDSYEDDAFIRDRAKALYFDPARVHPLSHDGDNFSIHGALNSARSPQGRPVLIQAGASEDGRALAARVAEVIFTQASTVAAGQAFACDIRARANVCGRDGDGIRILPELRLVVGATLDEARESYRALQARIHPDIIRLTIAGHLEIPLDEHPLDAPITPEMLPESANRHKSIFGALRTYIEAERPTLRGLFEHLEGQALCGTPQTISDMMEEWIDAGAADGFMLSFETLAGTPEQFFNGVVPELQRRGRFRRDYAGPHLRDHLGLSRPANLYTAQHSVEKIAR